MWSNLAINRPAIEAPVSEGALNVHLGLQGMNAVLLPKIVRTMVPITLFVPVIMPVVIFPPPGFCGLRECGKADDGGEGDFGEKTGIHKACGFSEVSA